MNVAPWWCSCPWFKFRKCGCPPGTLNCFLCHHTVRGNWFDACYEKTMGYLTGATESTSPDAVLRRSVSGQHWAIPSHLSQAWPSSHLLAQTPALSPGLGYLPSSQPQPDGGLTHSGLLSFHWEMLPGSQPPAPSCCFQGRNSAYELGKVWKKLSKVIPRLSVSHFDLFCGTCALVRNSKILWAASPGNNVYQHTMISRWILRRGQGARESGPLPESSVSFCSPSQAEPGPP